MATTEHRLLKNGYDEYEDLCSSVAVLLRHALTIGDGDNDEDDDPATFFVEAIFCCYEVVSVTSLAQSGLMFSD